MIARELLVKLGFDIDGVKLDRFNASIDATKSKMMSLRQGVISNFGNFAPEISAKFNELKNYQEELASLSKSERAEVLALNRIEKQAIKETTQVEKAEVKERQRVTREQFKEKQTLQRTEQRDFKTSIASMSTIAHKFAIVGASITAGFGLSIRSTLKDAASFKEGKSSSSFDKSQIAAVDAFNGALDSTKSIVTSLRNSFVIDMLPAIKETLEVFNAWVQQNKALIQEKLKNIVEGLAGAFKILSSVIRQVLSVLDFIIEKTVGWKVAITAVISLGAAAWFISLANSVTLAARAFKALSLAMLTNPLTWIITGIALAIAWLTDEMIAFRNGGKTTADLLKEWGGGWAVFGGEIERVYTNISNLIDAFKELDAIKISKTLAKMLNPFSMITDNEVIKVGFEKGVNKLSNPFNNDSGKLGQGNVKHYALPKYEPEEVSRVSNSNSINNTNNTRSMTINQKNPFNITVNVPSGTSQEQATIISKMVKNEFDKYHEQTLAQLGVVN